VSKFDFFPVLGSGIYFLVSISLVLIAWMEPRDKWVTPQAPAAIAELKDDTTSTNRIPVLSVRGDSNFGHSVAALSIRWCLKVLESHWPISVGLLFFAYLTGNVLRALPVNRADAICAIWAEPGSNVFLRFVRRILVRFCRKNRPTRRPRLWPLIRNLRRSPFQQDLNKRNFPYPVMLNTQVSMLTGNGVPLGGFTTPEGRSLHTMYNFWKAVLAGAKTGNFEQVQEQEARVRLFANMYWAGFLSMFPLSMGVALSVIHIFDRSWLWPMLAAFTISLVLAFTIGSQVRRVRGQEVFSVFMAYVALRTGNGNH